MSERAVTAQTCYTVGCHLEDAAMDFCDTDLAFVQSAQPVLAWPAAVCTRSYAAAFVPHKFSHAEPDHRVMNPVLTPLSPCVHKIKQSIKQ